jgi:HlyD family secretion protein
MKLSKTQRIAAAAMVLACIVLYLVFRPAPLPVDSDVVSKGPLQMLLEGEGITRVNDRFVISSPVTGRLERITLEEGDSVTRGSAVASILPGALDARDLREASMRAGSGKAAYQEAMARERSVMLDLEQAKRRAGRYKNLYEEGAVSRESYEIAEKEAGVLQKESEAARSGAAAARYSYEALESRVDSRLSSKAVDVIAPVDGKILRVLEKSERVVNAGAPLLEVGDPAALEIVIDVLSSDAVSVHPGSRVIITDWGGQRDIEAVVRRVEPAAFTKTSALGIEEKRVNIIASLVKAEPLLGDNFRVQAKIILKEKSNVVQVPVSSLFRGKASWEVFVIEQGRAVIRPIVLGMKGIWKAEVVSGLSPGNRVVVHPTNELQNGMRVKTKE